MPDSNPHLMTLFADALGHPPGADRDAYLERACAGDAALREQVEGLLRAHGRGGRFLEPGPAAGPTAEFPADGATAAWAGPPAGAGAVIAGRYKLLEEVGQGGMGAVWMAEQTEPVQRRVALKLIKPGMDSRQVLARFEAERQALALMDHPNIAKVFDGGVAEDGRPFFVMELVKGQPITKYCDEKKLTVRERLSLFADVCRAVQHAHQKGIIHRDIKPSNVLVAPYDGRAVVKVIDFGIAKAMGQKLTEATLFTGFGAVVGTPEYMSPEQAESNNADIDTRSDVYSLGVLLYELLTGTTPLTRHRVKEAALLEVLRVIREEEAPRPSTRLSSTDELPSIAAVRGVEPARLTKLVRGELDWIVMKALEKDRSRRYETANGFAADVQRFLADDPVQACPPSTGYRLRKFTRRNKGPLAAAAAVGLALVLGTVVSAWQAVTATQARDREREARADLDRERIDRDEQRGRVNAELGDALVRVARLRERARAGGLAAVTALAELPEAVNRAEALTGGELIDPAQAARARGLLAEVRKDEADRRMVGRLATVRLQSRASRTGSARAFDAGAAFAAAFRDYGLPAAELPPEDAAARVRGSAIRTELLAGLDDWADCDIRSRGTTWKRLLAVGVAADDEPWRRECRAAVLSGDRAALAKLARVDDAPRQSPGVVLLLARALTAPGFFGSAAVRRPEVTAAVELLKKAQVWHPEDARIPIDLSVHAPAQRPGVAQTADAVTASRENLRRLQTSGAGPEILAPAHYALGQLLESSQDKDGAIAAYREAVRLSPDSAEYRVALVEVLQKEGRQGEMLAACNDWIRSGPPHLLPYSRRADAYIQTQQWSLMLADATRMTDIDPREPQCWERKGYALSRLRRFPEAEAAYTRAIEASRAEGMTRARPITYLYGRMYLYESMRQFDAALADANAVLEIDPRNRTALHARILISLDQGKSDRALAYANEWVKLEPKFALNERIFVYSRLKQWDRALADCEEWARLAPNDWLAHDRLAHFLLGSSDPKFRDFRRALEHARKAIELGPKAPYVWRTLGAAHYHLGEWKEAAAALTRFAEFGEEPGYFLSIALWHLGKKDEARAAFGRTVKRDKANVGVVVSELIYGSRMEAAKLLGVESPQKEPK